MELEAVEAVEFLDGLEPLLRSLASAGLSHGYVCRDTTVWLDHEQLSGTDALWPDPIDRLAVQN